MDVFALRNELVDDYATFIRSFIRIQDQCIRDHVEGELRDGVLWPDPLIQLNPSFRPGAWIDDLVSGGVLHPLCKEIFRIHKAEKPPLGDRMRLHKHQSDAIEAAKSGSLSRSRWNRWFNSTYEPMVGSFVEKRPTAAASNLIRLHVYCKDW